MLNRIRNFCIIAHIDHGKSTLADRFLELTATVEKRQMREQYLDQMELERERGITIKMQPVRMLYRPLSSKLQTLSSKQVQNSNNQELKHLEFRTSNLEFADSEYILNLIDTPGHIDFSYEVSRSLKAVEGVILLVDATQGVQAQTISNLEMARAENLVIIPVINKIDSPNARIEEVSREIEELLKCPKEEILEISAKTGEGVENLLGEIIRRIPPPASNRLTMSVDHRHRKSVNALRALVFDFEYLPHRGVVLYVRIFNGMVKKGDNVFLFRAKKHFQVGEVGIFTPLYKETDTLSSGEIGYVVTNIKEPNIAKIGDTLLGKDSEEPPLEGYKEPLPVVWAAVFPEEQHLFDNLKQALLRLKLRDSSLSFEEERSSVLGRGFRCGFLGMLHLEIVVERLKREFNLPLIVVNPTVVYEVETKRNEIKTVYSPPLFPDYFEIKKILEPWAKVEVITPIPKLSAVLKVLRKHDARVRETREFGEGRLIVVCEMALREIVANFFEELKSATEGYASFNYEITQKKEADLVRLDVVLNDKRVPAFSRIVKRSDMLRQAQGIAKQLKSLLPRALFSIKIQVAAVGRILASQTLPALKKDVTGHLYGGDRTRKMKLWQKQKKGKKKMKKFGQINIPPDVFIKMIKN